MRILPTIIVVIIFITGCSAQYTDYDVLETGRLRLSENRTLLENKKYEILYKRLVRTGDLERNDKIGNETREMLKNQKSFFSFVDKYLHKVARYDLDTPTKVTSFIRELMRGEKAALITPQLSAELQDIASRAGQEGNLSGRLPFTLENDYEIVDGLSSGKQYLTIVERSIEKLESQNSVSRNLLQKVMDAAARENSGSKIRKKVEKSLPKINLSRKELKDYVSPVFPEYAQRAIDAKSIAISLSGDDALLEADLINRITERNAGIVIKESLPPTTEVKFRKLRWNERTNPTNSKTVRYAQYQVDLLAAALLMPRNATYAFEHHSGSSSIEYAVELIFQKNGKIVTKEIMRDTVTEKYGHCDGARIINVFGGEQPASFVANDAMKSMCQGRKNPVDMEQLRSSIVNRLTNEIVQTVQSASSS